MTTIGRKARRKRLKIHGKLLSPKKIRSNRRKKSNRRNWSPQYWTKLFSKSLDDY